MHAPLILADSGWTGWWIRRFQPKRSVRTMDVVMVDVASQHLLHVPASSDQQPVQALCADLTDPALRVGWRWASAPA
jgi:hypothetical protein